MDVNIPALLSFLSIVQSDGHHFIVPLDQSERATDWLDRNDIQHTATDLYLVNSQPTATGCCFVSITDHAEAVFFRLWANEDVTGPI